MRVLEDFKSYERTNLIDVGHIWRILELVEPETLEFVWSKECSYFEGVLPEWDESALELAPSSTLITYTSFTSLVSITLPNLHLSKP